MTKEKLPSEKGCSVQTVLALCPEGRGGGTATGICPEGVLLLGTSTGRAAVRAQHNLGLCSPSTEPFGAGGSASFCLFSSFVEESPMVLICPAGDGGGTADPAHAKRPWLPQTSQALIFFQ